MLCALPYLSSVLPALSSALPGAPKVLSGTPRCSQTYHNHSHGTPVPVIKDPSYSEGQPECPPRVWYSPEFDAPKFTHHILSVTPGGFQWLKYILLMLLCPGKTTPCFFSSQTSAWCFSISGCISSISARGNPHLAILAIFKSRLVTDCSSCTRPPFLAIVADMLKTFHKLVAASNRKIWRLP